MPRYRPSSPSLADRDEPASHELWQVGEALEGAQHDDAYADEDEYGPGVIVYSHNDEDEFEDEPAQSDLADTAYLDPLALVNAWEGALADLKELHQERFLPPTEAPLSRAQKQAKASFWYGPPPSEASTSKLPPRTQDDDDDPVSASYTASVEPTDAVEYAEYAGYAEYDAPRAKKRKRPTGSQKKARKVAKLQAGGSSAAVSAVSNGKAKAVQYGKDEGDEDDGPSWQPDSPPHMPAAPVAALSEHAPPVVPDRQAHPTRPTQSTIAPTVTAPVFPSFPPAPQPGSARPASSPSASVSSSPFSFPIPPVASLPTHYPAPPTIPPLSGTEAPLEPETPEQLLEAALWSWFTAGYQTALLHAAAGVARFAPSRGEGGEGRE